METLGHIPEVGEACECGILKLTVRSADGQRVDRVNIVVTPPEPAEAGLERFRYVTETVKGACPELPVVLSGLSYYRKEMLEKADQMLQDGVADFAGFGRIILAYPEFYKDWLNGSLEQKKLCALCSKCTVLMRNKCVSGCAVHDEYYRELLKGLNK